MGDAADFCNEGYWEDEPQGEWITQEGIVMQFAEMTTSHLFYSVRMIYNHTAPPAFQVPNCKHYSGFDWPAELRAMAIRDLLAELSTRKDIKPWMINQLRHMRDCIRTLKIPALNP